VPFRLCQWREEVDDFLSEIDTPTTARAIRLLAQLAEHGSNRTGHSKALGKGLFELKVDHGSNAYRLFYMFWANQVVVLLWHQKKSQRLPDHIVKTARERKSKVERDEASIGRLKLN
jgi:phage-related protein